jgi:hypothetical protein
MEPTDPDNTQQLCELCGDDHDTTNHNEVIRRQAREGKKIYIVRVIHTDKYRVWADSPTSAEDAVYWRRSSGLLYPEVDDLVVGLGQYEVEVSEEK